MAGCTWPTELPSSARPMDVPAIYARWWAMTEACSGRSADLASIRWYRVPGGSIPNRGTTVLGYYSPSEHEIVVSDSLVDNGAGIRHEMLHALLNVDGHPRSQFLGACADVVVCELNCVEDGGQWVAPAPFDTLPVDSLLVSGDIQLLPRETDGQRWVALWITVQNPSDHAILAVPNGARLGWGINVSGDYSVSQPAQDSSVFFFSPRQVRRWLYELRVAEPLNRFTLSPGRHSLTGGFGQHWTPWVEITAIP